MPPSARFHVVLVVTSLTLAALIPGQARAERRASVAPNQQRGQAAHQVKRGRLRRMAGAMGRTVTRPFKAMGRGTRTLYRHAKARSVSSYNRLQDVQPSTVRNFSTGSLLVSSTGGLMQLTRVAGPLAGPITGIGSFGLGYMSIRDLRRAKTTEKRIEAAHGLAWSMQGLTSLGYALQSKAAWLQPTSKVLGIAGGTLQAGIGLHRLASGIKNRSRERIVLGALDIGGGACWAASACALATPWTLGGFVALTTVRMGYEHRDKIKAAAHKLKDKVKSKFRRKPRQEPRPIRLRVPTELRVPTPVGVRLAM